MSGYTYDVDYDSVNESTILKKYNLDKIYVNKSNDKLIDDIIEKINRTGRLSCKYLPEQSGNIVSVLAQGVIYTTMKNLIGNEEIFDRVKDKIYKGMNIDETYDDLDLSANILRNKIIEYCNTIGFHLIVYQENDKFITSLEPKYSLGKINNINVLPMVETYTGYGYIIEIENLNIKVFRSHLLSIEVINYKTLKTYSDIRNIFENIVKNVNNDKNDKNDKNVTIDKLRPLDMICKNLQNTSDIKHNMYMKYLCLGHPRYGYYRFAEQKQIDIIKKYKLDKIYYNSSWDSTKSQDTKNKMIDKIIEKFNLENRIPYESIFEGIISKGINTNEKNISLAIARGVNMVTSDGGYYLPDQRLKETIKIVDSFRIKRTVLADFLDSYCNVNNTTILIYSSSDDDIISLTPKLYPVKKSNEWVQNIIIAIAEGKDYYRYITKMDELVTVKNAKSLLDIRELGYEDLQKNGVIRELFTRLMEADRRETTGANVFISNDKSPITAFCNWTKEKDSVMKIRYLCLGHPRYLGDINKTPEKKSEKSPETRDEISTNVADEIMKKYNLYTIYSLRNDPSSSVPVNYQQFLVNIISTFGKNCGINCETLKQDPSFAYDNQTYRGKSLYLSIAQGNLYIRNKKEPIKKNAISEAYSIMQSIGHLDPESQYEPLALLIGNNIYSGDNIEEIKSFMDEGYETLSSILSKYCEEKNLVVIIYNVDDSYMIKSLIPEEILPHSYVDYKINKTVIIIAHKPNHYEFITKIGNLDTVYNSQVLLHLATTNYKIIEEKIPKIKELFETFRRVVTDPTNNASAGSDLINYAYENNKEIPLITNIWLEFARSGQCDHNQHIIDTYIREAYSDSTQTQPPTFKSRALFAPTKTLTQSPTISKTPAKETIKRSPITTDETPTKSIASMAPTITPSLPTSITSTTITLTTSKTPAKETIKRSPITIDKTPTKSIASMIPTITPSLSTSMTPTKLMTPIKSMTSTITSTKTPTKSIPLISTITPAKSSITTGETQNNIPINVVDEIMKKYNLFLINHKKLGSNPSPDDEKALNGIISKFGKNCGLRCETVKQGGTFTYNRQKYTSKCLYLSIAAGMLYIEDKKKPDTKKVEEQAYSIMKAVSHLDPYSEYDTELLVRGDKIYTDTDYEERSSLVHQGYSCLSNNLSDYCLHNNLVVIIYESDDSYMIKSLRPRDQILPYGYTGYGDGKKVIIIAHKPAHFEFITKLGDLDTVNNSNVLLYLSTTNYVEVIKNPKIKELYEKIQMTTVNPDYNDKRVIMDLIEDAYKNNKTFWMEYIRLGFAWHGNCDYNPNVIIEYTNQMRPDLPETLLFLEYPPRSAGLSKIQPTSSTRSQPTFNIIPSTKTSNIPKSFSAKTPSISSPKLQSIFPSKTQPISSMITQPSTTFSTKPHTTSTTFSMKPPTTSTTFSMKPPTTSTTFSMKPSTTSTSTTFSMKPSTTSTTFSMKPSTTSSNFPTLSNDPIKSINVPMSTSYKSTATSIPAKTSVTKTIESDNETLNAMRRKALDIIKSRQKQSVTFTTDPDAIADMKRQALEKLKSRQKQSVTFTTDPVVIADMKRQAMMILKNKQR